MLTMKARFLGSSPLTILIRCLCGYRNYFSRQRWDYFRGGICDNCTAWIEYTFRVRPLERGGLQVALDIEYEHTPEREAIMTAFNIAKGELERAANLLSKSGSRERAYKALNLAQQAAAQVCLLEQDWTIEDAKVQRETYDTLC